MRESLKHPIHLTDDEATRALGRKLGAALAATVGHSPVVYFNGELGAGKTTMIGALLTSFGLSGTAKSPTYTLVEPYELNGRQILHVDLYRLVRPVEAEALALTDQLVDGAILLVEWAERGLGFVPLPDIEVNLSYGARGGRDVELIGRSHLGLETLKQTGLP
jgi:tRNA threonylcarbamoyladenosine biosynthesis protein TsaE